MQITNCNGIFNFPDIVHSLFPVLHSAKCPDVLAKLWDAHFQIARIRIVILPWLRGCVHIANRLHALVVVDASVANGHLQKDSVFARFVVDSVHIVYRSRQL